MNLSHDGSLSVTDPGFGAVVREDELVLPVELWRICRALGVDTSEGLVSYVCTHPHRVSRWFHTSPEAVYTATDELIKLIVGKS